MEGEPEEAVTGFDPGLGSGALEDGELMPEGEIFEQELGPRLAGREQGAEDCQNECEHGAMRMVLAAQNSRLLNEFGLFATHKR